MPYDSSNLDDLTKLIIGRAYEVHNTLGPGFLEKVYENALTWELQQLSLSVVQQAPLPVQYKGMTVGEYFADLIVEHQVIVEIKAVHALVPEHEVQLVHYLTATGIDHGLLVNFGPSVLVRRKFREYRQTKERYTMNERQL